MIELHLNMQNKEQQEWLSTITQEIDSYMYDYQDTDAGVYDYIVDDYLNKADGKEKK